MFDFAHAQLAAGTVIRRALPGELMRLRRRVLLGPDAPITLAACEKDPLLTTVHLGIFLPPTSGNCKETPIACASFALEPLLQRPNGPPAWKLYRMATDVGLQRRGYGRQLITWAEKRLTQSAVKWLWCEARFDTIPFYRKLGWDCEGDEFLMPTGGMHRYMCKACF